MMRRPYKNKDYLLIVFSSDRGLAGSFNYTVAKAAIQRIDELEAEGINVKVICIGKKAYDIIRRTHEKNIDEYRDDLGKKGADYKEMKSFGFKILNRFNGRDIDVVEVITSKFISAINREVVPRQVLPIILTKPEEFEQDPSMVDNAAYEYESDKMTMLTETLALLFRAFIFQAMVHSQASEHSARMTSMDNATRNAQDIIKNLTLKYNGIRQSAITTELIEIIAGAEAV
jgi:F-type H+-transporting ATPase subunit gamma